MFVDLRRQLHKIAGHATDTRIVYVAEEAVQPVAELVEEGRSLVGTEQGRLALDGLGEVADDGHHGDDAVAVLVIPLRTIAATPGSTTLAGTGEEVEVNDSQRLAVLVDALEDLRLGMGQRHVGERAETDAIQAGSHIESSLAHVVQLQIGAHFVLVDVKLGLPGFLEVVAPVPTFGLELLAVLLDFGLDVLQLFLGFRQRRFPNLVEQGIHLVGCLGHARLQRQRGIVFVPHQAGLLQAGLQQFAHHGLVVGVIAVVAAVGVGLEDLFAQGTVVGILQEGHHTGILQGKHPLALQSLLTGRLGGRGYQRGGQAGEVGFVVDDQLVGVRFLKHVLPEGELKQGDAAVQLAQLLLVGLTEVGAAAHKVLVGFFEQFRLLLVQSHAFAVVVHLLDAGKESGVERDVVAMGRKQG